MFEAADQRLTDLGEMARPKMHPAAAHVRALTLKGRELRSRLADVDESREFDALDLRIAAIFG